MTLLNKYLIANAGILAIQVLDLVFLYRLSGNLIGLSIFNRWRRIKMVKHSNYFIRVPDPGDTCIG